MRFSNRVRTHGTDVGWVRARLSQAGHASFLAWLGPALMVLGSALMIYTIAVFTDACVYDSQQKAILDLANKSSRPPEAHPTVGAGTGKLIGRVDIPRVGVSAVVVDSVDDIALRRAVGLVPGSAWPGSPGTSVLAGHRDQLFRGLKEIRSGDEVTVTMPGQRVRYRITGTRIVDREQVEHGVPAGRADLTLFTCYPFQYIGSAPKRFLAEARRIVDSSRNSVPVND